MRTRAKTRSRKPWDGDNSSRFKEEEEGGGGGGFWLKLVCYLHRLHYKKYNPALASPMLSASHPHQS
jgi:hypothetical protein